MPDQIAFRNELVSLLPRLRRFALALAGNRDAAEDLLQSAVERGLRKWGTYEKGRSLSSWMFKLMQNIWFDMRRSAAAGPSYPGELPDSVGEDGRELVEARDELQAVREAFAALPEDQRTVMALVVLDGLSYAQAAETLALPMGTVMSRLSRARAALASLTKGNMTIKPIRIEVRKELRKED
jgi:RNA polymerase sigma-70 factor (ECF subfamily)